MNIFFQTQNIEVNQFNRDAMAQKMYSVERLLSPYAKGYIDIQKTRASHNGKDLYSVSITIEDGKHHYFAQEYHEEVKTTFDRTFADIARQVKDDKSKSRTLARKAGASLKRLFRKR